MTGQQRPSGRSASPHLRFERLPQTRALPEVAAREPHWEANRLLGHYQRMRCRAGVAPVTRQSGKTRYVQQRWACDRQLKIFMVHWARNAILNDDHLRARYDEIRARGHGHYRALRQVADRLLRILAAMIETRALYDTTRHQIDQEAA